MHEYDARFAESKKVEVLLLVDADHRWQLANHRRFQGPTSRSSAEGPGLLAQGWSTELRELCIHEVDELRGAQVGPGPRELVEIVEVANGVACEGRAYLLGASFVGIERVAVRRGIRADEGVDEQLIEGDPPRARIVGRSETSILIACGPNADS